MNFNEKSMILINNRLHSVALKIPIAALWRRTWVRHGNLLSPHAGPAGEESVRVRG